MNWHVVFGDVCANEIALLRTTNTNSSSTAGVMEVDGWCLDGASHCEGIQRHMARTCSSYKKQGTAIDRTVDQAVALGVDGKC